MASTETPADPPPDYDQAAAEHGAEPRQTQKAPVRRPPPPFELPIISRLRGKRIILASASPRRRALLAQVGFKNLEILPSTKPENLSKNEYGPYEYVAATARQKCLDVYETALQQQSTAASAPKSSSNSKPPEDPELVIAADTIIVSRDGRILEKPRSEAEHRKMLTYLRDTNVHRVLTAVVVIAPKEDATHPGYEIAAHTEETKVYFAQADDGLPDDVIVSYVKTREGADKAGGYAIQGIGGMVLVERIEGSWDNVVGLPVRKTLALAEKVVFRQGEEEEVAEEE